MVINKNIFKKRKSFLIIAVVLLVILALYFFIYRTNPQKNSSIVQEQDISFDPEGPYALLSPRKDGNALILDLKRTASYDGISYELAYNSDGIDRGVVGSIDTKDKKGEYEQEILFGTCSKNVCKYDPNVENGTLTLHIKKGSAAYRMVTQWHLQKPDVALGKLTSGDDHFNYQTTATRQELALVGFSIINDLSGLPKLPNGKEVSGKVYALNLPLGKTLPNGQVSIELANNPPAEAQIARYSDSSNDWIMLDTKISGSKLTAAAEGSGIFAVLIPKD